LKDNDGKFSPIRKTEKIENFDTRISGESDGIEKNLLERISERYVDFLLKNLPPSIIRKLSTFDNLSSEEKIFGVCETLEDKHIASLVYDVMIFLKEGNLDQAITRIELEKGGAIEIEKLTESEFIQVDNGDTIRRIELGSVEYQKWINDFIDSATYQEWMLFMHPMQEKMVDMDFSGSAKLSGVSGSGKTCIIVNRAIRLAKKILKSQY